MKMYAILLFILILVFPSNLYSDNEIKDVLYLKDGRKLGGRVVRDVPGDYLEFEFVSGETSVFRYKEIDHVAVGGFFEPDDEHTDTEPVVENADTVNVAKEYTYFGMSFGTPALCNFLLGHWFDMFGVSITGGYWGANARGIQLNTGLKVYDNGKTSHSFMAVAGYSNYLNFNGSDSNNSNNMNTEKKNMEWNYLGLVYIFNYKSFFVSYGIAPGSHDYPGIQSLFQMGMRLKLQGK